MYTFGVQNRIGQQFEEAFDSLCFSKNIESLPNPYNGTSDPRRKDYDRLVAGKWYCEIKGNPKAKETGNIAIETDILDHSKADLFIIYYPALFECWDARVLTRLQLEDLLQKPWRKTEGGQVLPDGTQKEFKLVPIKEFTFYGIALSQFVN